MRALTSVSTALPFPLPEAVARPIAASAVLFELFFLLSQTSHVLVKCAAATFFGSHRLEFRNFLKAGLDFLVSITQSDRGVQTLHVGSQVVDSPALLALGMPVLI
jgi:hypothetical protein